jgi:hypothetical protein
MLIVFLIKLLFTPIFNFQYKIFTVNNTKTDMSTSYYLKYKKQTLLIIKDPVIGNLSYAADSIKY